VIAGEVGFLPVFVRPHLSGQPSFEEIDLPRNTLAPEASREAALYGFMNSWETPCLYVRAELGFKKQEEAGLEEPDGGRRAAEKRLLHVESSEGRSEPGTA
jgi:hypothetical protein